jgi:hypothetical protein
MAKDDKKKDAASKPAPAPAPAPTAARPSPAPARASSTSPSVGQTATRPKAAKTPTSPPRRNDAPRQTGSDTDDVSDTRGRSPEPATRATPKPSDAGAHYTRPTEVPLKHGQTLGYTAGKGYYATTRPNPTKASRTPQSSTTKVVARSTRGSTESPIKEHVETRDGKRTVTLSHRSKGAATPKTSGDETHKTPVKTKKASSRVDEQLAKTARAKSKPGTKPKHGTKHGTVRLIPGGERKQGVQEFATSSYLVKTDISTNVNGGVELDVDSDGTLVFKSGDTVIYTLPTDGLGQLEASFTLGGSEFVASVNAKLPSIPGVDSEVELNSDGSVTLSLKSRGVESEFTFKPDGEIEIETTVTRDSQGQSVALSLSTTLTPRPGAKEPASQPAKQAGRIPAPATKHATATVPARTVAAKKANKPYTYSPRYGDMPPTGVAAPGFALADDVDPQTAQYALEYVIKSVVGDFEGGVTDAEGAG